MHHESNWLEYIHKLANDRQSPAFLVDQKTRELRSRIGAAHAPPIRDEWLQAGYPAQLSFPFRAGR